MQQAEPGSIQDIYRHPGKNHDLVLKLFNAYYRSHTHTGKLYDELPDTFLVEPEVLTLKDLATRPSDKLILEDCIQRAQARTGYVCVKKHLNPKLNYYWLDLGVRPFTLGDEVEESNKIEFFFLVAHFVDYARRNPNIYGDMTAEMDSDKDLALMLKEIFKTGRQLQPLLEIYPLDKLVYVNPNWPATEVNKLLQSLKGNEHGWCEVFFEYLIYVMGKKT